MQSLFYATVMVIFDKLCSSKQVCKIIRKKLIWVLVTIATYGTGKRYNGIIVYLHKIYLTRNVVINNGECYTIVD